MRLQVLHGPRCSRAAWLCPSTEAIRVSWLMWALCWFKFWDECRPCMYETLASAPAAPSCTRPRAGLASCMGAVSSPATYCYKAGQVWACTGVGGAAALIMSTTLKTEKLTLRSAGQLRTTFLIGHAGQTQDPECNRCLQAPC